MNTARCRQRRNTIDSATTDRPSAVAPQPEPATLIPSATSVSHGVLTATSRVSSHVLAWSSNRSDGVCCATTNAPVRTTAARTSHAVVLNVIGCGSGGGAPVGRRCRRVLWTAAPGGTLAGPFPAATRPMSSLNVRQPPPGSAHVRAASCWPPLCAACAISYVLPPWQGAPGQPARRHGQPVGGQPVALNARPGASRAARASRARVWLKPRPRLLYGQGVPA